MFDSTMIDIVIGLILVYLVISLVCTAINELIAQLFALRCKKLADGIESMLPDGFAAQLYDHPLIKQLAKPGRWERFFSRMKIGDSSAGPDEPGAEMAKPSYIPAKLFAMALFDIISPSAGATTTKSDLKSMIESIPSPVVKGALEALLKSAGGDIEQWKSAVETWFDDAMDRVTGQYKRNMQIITLAIAVAITGVMNADSYVIAKRLSQDESLRAATVALAERVVEEGYPERTEPADATAGFVVDATPEPALVADAPAVATPAGDTSVSTEPEATPTPGPPVDPEAVSRLLDDMEQLGLPLGWSDDTLVPGSLTGWLAKALGLLFTAIAVSLGAPFWFDMLSKFVRVRAAGEKPARSDAPKT